MIKLNSHKKMRLFKNIIGMGALVIGVPFLLVGFSLMMVFEWANK